MSIRNTIDYFPEKLREFSLNPKVAELLDYIIDNAYNDLDDIKNKYRDAEMASEDMVEAIINEYGFGYINELTSTISNLDYNILLQFMSLLHFLKGTREGLELILNVLGFEIIIEEWWEQSPQGEPHTFNMTIDMNLTNIPDVLETLQKIRQFTEEYVYPKFEIANLSFLLQFVESSPILAGFATQVHDGTITGSL